MLSLFHCESNIAVAAAVSGATGILSIVMIVLMNKVFKNNHVSSIIATAVCFICAVVATLFCFNPIVLAGYIISVICTGIALTKLCALMHQNTIYNVSPLHMFAKFIIPVSVFFEMFRPFFVDCKSEDDIKYYSIWSAFGLRCHSETAGKYATVVNARGIEAFDIDWSDVKIVSIITLLLFLTVLAMQAVLIWRQFADPDNARDWADVGIIVTCIGALFIYGMYTSNNFNVQNASYSVEHTSMTVFVIVLLGALNRVLYFTKVEEFLDKISAKLFKNA